MSEDYDYIVGLDFGHGETSVSKVDVASLKPLATEIDATDLYIVGTGRERKIPSMIAYDSDGRRLLNIEAFQFPNLDVQAYFKAPMIASPGVDAITEEKKQSFKDFVLEVFAQLHAHPYNCDLIGKKVKYYVACPSGWTKEQRQAYLCFFQSECSLPVSGIIEESRAAHVVARRKLHELNPELGAYDKRIVVLDLGSSTLDITMHADRTYTDGYEIGASQIEILLLDYFLSTDEDFKESYEAYQALASTCRQQVLYLLRQAKENYYSKLFSHPDLDIRFKCQIDWEELSNERMDGISYLKLSTEKLETLLDSHGIGTDKYKDKLRASILDFMSRHGNADAVVLTGGASQMAFYKQVVLDCFHLPESACLVDDTPSYSISRGTAIIGYMDTQNPVSNDSALPEELVKLQESLPETVRSAILQSSIDTYVNELNAVVDKWSAKTADRTLRSLYEDFTGLLASWDEHDDEISEMTNQRVATTVSESISASLSQMMQLYFGYTTRLMPMKVEYDFGMCLPHEQNMQLLKRIYMNFKTIICSSIFRTFNDPESLDKDRSDDPSLTQEIVTGTKSFISSWFSTFRLDDGFGEEIADLQEKTKTFYFDCIRNITCQI